MTDIKHLRTRLTERLEIVHPIISAPMALAAGGALAKAVSQAGGLGLIGGGYGDAGFLDQAYRDAGNARTGCGFITWSLAQNPDLLDLVLGHRPAAVMLSFGDPGPFAPKIKAAGIPLLCQCQTLDHAREALDHGADIIVAQGGEAGGHGAVRGTLNFVPEVADLLAKDAPETMLVAAGGIADGRGLASALILGADGVLVGTRFWAAAESLAPEAHKIAAIQAGGDDTVKSKAVDIVRGKDWPEEFSLRVRRNAFTDRWDGQEAALRAALDTEIPRYNAAIAKGDAAESAPICGEAIGLIDTVEPAESIVVRMAKDAAAHLVNATTFLEK